MNPRRKMVRAKKKLVMLTGTNEPKEKLRQMVAWHTLENLEQMLRIASPKKVELETRALQGKFPEIGKRIAKKPAAERIAIMGKFDLLGRKSIEKALEKGFALQELLRYPDAKSLASFLRTTTPERMGQLKQLGFSESMARKLCPLIERYGFEKTAAFIDGIRRMGHDPNKVRMITYLDFYQTGIPGITWPENKPFEPIVLKPGKPMALAETDRAIVFQRPGTRRRFVDFRRHGKPRFAEKFSFSGEKASALAKKGINPFEFSGKVKRIVSSNIIIGHGGRHAFYLEVPEIADLLREARPKRQHLRNVLAFADITSIQAGPQKGIHIYELQSDIAGKLREPNREKYRSWAELTVLGLADFAAKNGYEFMDLSSPHIIKQVWPQFGRELTQKLYYDLPKKMGFELIQRKTAVQQYDSAFGQQQFGKSKIIWRVEINTLKKKFPEFFK